MLREDGEDVVPEAACDNPSCARPFHVRCLVEWLRADGSARQSFQTLFGLCPYCSQPITVKPSISAVQNIQPAVDQCGAEQSASRERGAEHQCVRSSQPADQCGGAVSQPPISAVRSIQPAADQCVSQPLISAVRSIQPAVDQCGAEQSAGRFPSPSFRFQAWTCTRARTRNGPAGNGPAGNGPAGNPQGSPGEGRWLRASEPERPELWKFPRSSPSWTGQFLGEGNCSVRSWSGLADSKIESAARTNHRDEEKGDEAETSIFEMARSVSSTCGFEPGVSCPGCSPSVSPRELANPRPGNGSATAGSAARDHRAQRALVEAVPGDLQIKRGEERAGVALSGAAVLGSLMGSIAAWPSPPGCGSREVGGPLIPNIASLACNLCIAHLELWMVHETPSNFSGSSAPTEAPLMRMLLNTSRHRAATSSRARRTYIHRANLAAAIEREASDISDGHGRAELQEEAALPSHEKAAGQ
ncbi:hypothetical protein CYMTET_47692 [Cymbomonas tetramitiformis]|uniref:FANCL C-terminal domain-containing protein n=1 Tax=Cymbomonas tetramitiformis TaxID=36881 RepID=A0AAE0BUV0_9CHLO|nr:hypothetical protein CYMTET_47692 [Cymbomonas tetramitiformis]